MNPRQDSLEAETLEFGTHRSGGYVPLETDKIGDESGDMGSGHRGSRDVVCVLWSVQVVVRRGNYGVKTYDVRYYFLSMR